MKKGPAAIPSPPPVKGGGIPSPIGGRRNGAHSSPGRNSGSSPARAVSGDAPQAQAAAAASPRPAVAGLSPQYSNGSMLSQDTEFQHAHTFGTTGTQGTSLSRETTDIQGNRVRETTTVSTLPNGTTIRTTETTPLDPNQADVALTTVHERTEPSGQMTRITLTTEPDGSKVKQTETIRPGGSKTVMIETTDPAGHRNVETADYPPTLVSPPENYGRGSGMTVVSEITYPQTYAPWASRPVDVDDYGKEVYAGGGGAPEQAGGGGGSGGAVQPFWTKRRKMVVIGGSILIGVAAIGAGVGIAASGPKKDGAGQGAAQQQQQQGQGQEGGDVSTWDDYEGEETADENDGDTEPTQQEPQFPDLTPQAVGFDHEWPSEQGWVVAPSYADTDQSYYRAYLNIDELGLCADRCSKTDSVGGAYFPDATQGGQSLCYCFAEVGCIEPTLHFDGGTVFASRTRPDDVCTESMCSYFPGDLLCDGFDQELSPSTTTVATTSATPTPSGLRTDAPVAAPTEAPVPVPAPTESNIEVVDVGVVTEDPTPSPPTVASTVAPTMEPTVAPTMEPTVVATTVAPTVSPTTAATEEEECAVGPVEREVACADFRYVPWEDMQSTPRLLAQLKLGYTEVLWDNPGTAEIESRTWEQLSEDQKIGANSVGFKVQASWDCHQNHYRGYSWDALESEGVRVHYRTLGWNETSWSDSPPETDELAWSLLSSDQRGAAIELCYSELVWDGLGL